MMNTTPNPQWTNPAGGPQATNETAGAMEDEFFAPLSTLNEPIMDTIMRDVRSVGSKLRVVLLPMDRNVRTTLEECM
jgi:hypothetical protein